ncbi:MAG: bifunctional tetrahydrofolate synthase/dihydrofolate synthase [Chromatiales bacterium]|nr:bifunctional tetrahydrofolate synthase/dihydrofolate synthase [Chromatiales bacterium]
MRFSTLNEWLDWQLTLNPTEIRLGLDRVGAVWQELHPSPLSSRVITVGGTNGKGSSVAFLREILTAAGYRVGCYTSPHLYRYNERILIDGVEASDELICQAFEQIDQARQETPLTYFEFGTLAALWLFSEAQLDVILLEVGLGGRLDAVNIIDADAALITTVDLDHTDWLGDNREAIGYEKAGIMRPDRPTVFAGEQLPDSVVEHAEKVGSRLYVAERDFGFSVGEQGWNWWSETSNRRSLPLPTLRGHFQLRNASGVLMLLDQMKDSLPVDQQSVRAGLLAAKVAGRFEVLGKEPVVLLDVAHNPEAARSLRGNLKDMFCAGDTVAVFSMLADKDITRVVATMMEVIDRWHIFPLEGERAAAMDRLEQCLVEAGVAAKRINRFTDSATALTAAQEVAGSEGRVVAFGSFYLVGMIKSEMGF